MPTTDQPDSIGDVLRSDPDLEHRARELSRSPRAQEIAQQVAADEVGDGGEPPLGSAEWQQWASEQRRREDRKSNLSSLARECPRRFRHAAFSTLDLDSDGRDRLTEWAANPTGRNVLFAGTVGSGKTHAAVALAALMLGQRSGHTSVTFRTTVSLLNELRPGYEPRPDRYGFMDRPVVDPWDDEPAEPSDPLRNACRTDLLILDDIGVQRGTEWVAEQVSEIVDARWRDERPTIATTNLTLGPDGTLKPAIGERAYDRLVGSGAVVIRLTANSRRR